MSRHPRGDGIADGTGDAVTTKASLEDSNYGAYGYTIKNRRNCSNSVAYYPNKPQEKTVNFPIPTKLYEPKKFKG